MNTFYGVWTPLLGVLPDVKDLDFAAYYITESGSLPGDTTTYTKDNWLIYICESRGTLSERSYWRVTNGVVLFNPDAHTNVPDAGFYTKFRLDNAGNIVAASDIEYEDLPKEVYDKFEQITDENLNKLIAEQLSTIFKNNSLNPIQLKFDSKTGKIGAELKLDEETIGVNELGQLCCLSVPEGGSSTSAAPVELSMFTEELDVLKGRVADIEDAIVQIKPIEGAGIKVSVRKGGSVISANIDQDSIQINSEGQLCVNPDILAEYINEGSGGQCANHQHTAEQIEGLQQLVTQIINNSSITNVVKNNISNLVDETTIIVNKDGKLEAIATHVQKHQHKMDDITDLNQDIANVWATNQRLHAGNDNQDFNKGAILMSSLTIGEVLIAFNELLKEQAENIDLVSKRSGTIEPAEPGLINSVNFYDVSKKKRGLDTKTMEEVDVSWGDTIIETKDIIYYDGSIIHAFIDDVEVESFKAFDDANKTFGIGSQGNFDITYFGEAYPKFKTFQGYYKGFSFKYTAKNLKEGVHTIYFTQENVNSGLITKSDVITFNSIEKFVPTCGINILVEPKPNCFVSGVQAFKGEPKLKVQVVSKNFTSRFSPLYKNEFRTFLGTDEYLELESISGNMSVYKATDYDIDDFYGEGALVAAIADWDGKYSTFESKTTFINIDNSTEEAYRVVQESGELVPIDNGTDTFSVYDPKDALLDKYSNELQVKDHIAQLAKINYAAVKIGPDYSNKVAPQAITLRFPCTRINNFYFDLVDDEGQLFKENKDGTLQDIQIYAGIAPSTVVTRWVNCNTPYQGYGHWKDGIIFKALDLFRCEASRRYVTFGKDGYSDSGYLYIKLITNGKAFNLQKLIASIEESLNERK